ncbi:MAG: hypothetical protein SFU99_03050 [Saprospiraceae bacterium]|nr:hypothetical protein [Saprospiraceae bacterium]
MKRSLFFLFFIALGMTALQSCLFNGDEDDENILGNWIRRSDFEGIPRSNAVSFTIGNIAYVGLGYDGEDDLRDFWRYDAALDFWQRVDSFPGEGRRGAVAFAIGNRGYIGTGYNADLQNEELGDFWEFNPDAPSGQQWTRKADFVGTPRYNSVGFSINGKGYIGTGYDGNWLKDFYEYDPDTDTWTQVVSLKGAKREEAFAFVIDGKAYVGGGRNNGIYEYDFWAFDPASQEWTQKNDLNEDDNYAVIRHAGLGLSVGGLGYAIGGMSSSTVLGTVWEYDPNADLWEKKNNIEGSTRIHLAGFVINNRLFITTGNASGTRLDDTWEFKPFDELDDED